MGPDCRIIVLKVFAGAVNRRHLVTTSSMFKKIILTRTTTAKRIITFGLFTEQKNSEHLTVAQLYAD